MDSLRYKLCHILMDLAYWLSWDGYISYITDSGDFGFCPDCDQCYDPEWRCR
jgi:hypothetical protein